MRKLRTEKGKLTAYALHCGYVAHKNNKDMFYEHGLYGVQSFTEETKYFKTIKEARQYLDFGTITSKN